VASDPVGDARIYEKEAREGDMAHPETGRWRTQETIVRAETKPEGVLLLTRSITLDPLPHIAKPQRVKEFDESYSLIRGNCVYPGDMFRDDGPPDLCFPLSSGTTFGVLPQISPAEDFVWRAVGVDADPFGIKDQKAFYLTSHQGSGTMVDRGFVQGVGIVQEITEHHGTYDEFRRRLLSAMIDGEGIRISSSPRAQFH
jgi:hypothetical protein